MRVPQTDLSVLLISPKTYNYHSIICKSFEDSGIQCVWLDERPSSHFMYKIFSRLFNRLSRRFSASFYIRRLRSLFSSGFLPSHVLVIKGEALHSSVLDYLRVATPLSRFILYFWDSVANLPGHTSILRFFDCVASFDYRDCSQYSWTYFPLFAGNIANSISMNNSNLSCQYDWSFIGVVHSDRLYVLEKLLLYNSVSSCFYLYILFPSVAHLLRYLFSSPLTLFRLWPYIHFKPLSPHLLAYIYSSSRCIVDIHHPNQSGLTMRVIESLLSGLKVITTNSYVLNEPIYSPDRVMMIDRQEPLFAQSFLSSQFSPIPPSLANYYFPSQWVIRLLAL